VLPLITGLVQYCAPSGLYSSIAKRPYPLMTLSR
jgi:hypothetical protein